MSAKTSTPEELALPLLSAPADGVPEVVDTPAGLDAAVAALEAGHGSVAVDAERASGFRYGGRAFLIQLRREGAGTILIDPEPFDDLADVDEALRGSEWVLHAATQDLPCLAEAGMRPDALFDTELAARFLGFERFGLAAVVAETVGVRLAKEHSAVDWSKRPMPESWLNYAALDVEVLLEVADRLDERLHAADLAEFAQQEFEHLLDFAPPVRTDPWRRMSGLGALKTPRQLGRARALWELREATAQSKDLAPSKVLRDRDVTALAAERIRTPDQLFSVLGGGRMGRVEAKRWVSACIRADELPEEDLPPRREPAEPLPIPRRTSPDRAEAKERLDALKAALSELSEETGIPRELLLQPAVVKTVAARADLRDPEALAEDLAALGARRWQVEMCTPRLVDAARRLG